MPCSILFFEKIKKKKKKNADQLVNTETGRLDIPIPVVAKLFFPRAIKNNFFLSRAIKK
jgi:hypothetical protein